MINFQKRNVEIISSYVPDELCWNTPKEFIEILTKVLSGTISSASNEDFIIVGHQTPKPDQRNKIWARFTLNKNWLGFYGFIQNAWRKLYPYNFDDIIWKTGNSQQIPDGFQLITIDTPTLTEDVRTAIVNQYVETTPGSGIYNYFAVLYIGY